MVRANELSVAALMQAMERGDFYVSSGVILCDVTYDPKEGILSVMVDEQPGVHYTIDFIGTPVDYDRSVEILNVPPRIEDSKRPVQTYSADVGKVLKTVKGPHASYRLTGKELYVRAVVRSDKALAVGPLGGANNEQAWCQPVGWERWSKTKAVGYATDSTVSCDANP